MTFPSLLLALVSAVASAQERSYEWPPIEYSKATPSGPVAKLRSDLLAGRIAFEYDPEFGYLKATLAALRIPQSSQGLVFSKTSLQASKIHPWNPRAVYFNDGAYVGWVPGGTVIEISSVDPVLGGVFYTLSQERAERPRIVREYDRCLQCHDRRGLTLGVPGHTVRSVFPDAKGFPQLRMGTRRTTHASPFHERWGGWYVTGGHGKMRHLGNVTFTDDSPEALLEVVEKGANLQKLPSSVPVERYLEPTSDIVALMVLEHQTHVHNLITRAHHQTRFAVRQSREINTLLEEPADRLTAVARSRIEGACEPLVAALLFADEAPLTDAVVGDPRFAREFQKRGPFDSKGRSLRELDLRSRMFRYPLSYLAYSDAFRKLPTEALEYVLSRLGKILMGHDPDPKFDHLSAADREAVLAILRETAPALTRSWQ